MDRQVDRFLDRSIGPMPSYKWTLWGGMMLATVGTLLALTNPDEETYERFATQQLTRYLDEVVCSKTAADMGLKPQCEEFLQSRQGDLQDLIVRGTDRRNFFFFSLYTTELSIALVLPSYQVETVGLLQQFYIWNAEKE